MFFLPIKYQIGERFSLNAKYKGTQNEEKHIYNEFGITLVIQTLHVFNGNHVQK